MLFIRYWYEEDAEEDEDDEDKDKEGEVILKMTSFAKGYKRLLEKV